VMGAVRARCWNTILERVSARPRRWLAGPAKWRSAPTCGRRQGGGAQTPGWRSGCAAVQQQYSGTLKAKGRRQGVLLTVMCAQVLTSLQRSAPSQPYPRPLPRLYPQQLALPRPTHTPTHTYTPPCTHTSPHRLAVLEGDAAGPDPKPQQLAGAQPVPAVGSGARGLAASGASQGSPHPSWAPPAGYCPPHFLS
jgi:hypothetical protein